MPEPALFVAGMLALIAGLACVVREVISPRTRSAWIRRNCASMSTTTSHPGFGMRVSSFSAGLHGSGASRSIGDALRRIARATLVACAALATGCASLPDSRPAQSLLDDALFAPPRAHIDARDVFAPSPAMLEYARTEITDRFNLRGRRQGLLDALYDRAQLKLEYDSARTRNAAEAFAARAGNCLSLVIMTAAFAKELGLPVRYQTVFTDESWGRQGDLYLNVGHVNLSLGPSRIDPGRQRGADLLTVDFIPGTDLAGAYTRVVSESTIVAMYMNNRAAESLAGGLLDDAYAWAREAMRQDARFLSAYNTLGAIYWRHGNAAQAAAAFEYVLEREPANTAAMSNLVPALAALGRVAESQALGRKLASIEPNPPFAYYRRGIEALRAGDYAKAKALFEKEIARAAYYHEFHYWLAVAEINLGELDDARQNLAIALETSTTRGEHDVYAAKLARLKSLDRAWHAH